jgi:hypothetical protein
MELKEETVKLKKNTIEEDISMSQLQTLQEDASQNKCKLKEVSPGHFEFKQKLFG